MTSGAIHFEIGSGASLNTGVVIRHTRHLGDRHRIVRRFYRARRQEPVDLVFAVEVDVELRERGSVNHSDLRVVTTRARLLRIRLEESVRPIGVPSKTIRFPSAGDARRV
jgi:hypothetical protein